MHTITHAHAHTHTPVYTHCISSVVLPILPPSWCLLRSQEGPVAPISSLLHGLQQGGLREPAPAMWVSHRRAVEPQDGGRCPWWPPGDPPHLPPAYQLRLPGRGKCSLWVLPWL